MIFENPVILLGLLAAALPIVIHLLLRPRPIRIAFPAIALLKPALVAGTRSGKLKNILMLVLRALLLALAAFFLAAPRCDTERAVFEGAAPVAVAVVIDDSVSTAYQIDSQTTIGDALRSQAKALLQGAAGAPDGSSVGVFIASNEVIEHTWDSEQPLDVDALTQVARAGRGGKPLGAAIESATAFLRSAAGARPELYVFTDGAAHAWRDVGQRQLEGVHAARVRVVTVERYSPANIAITDLRAPRRPAAGSVIPLDATVRAWGVGVAAELHLRQNGDGWERVAAFDLSRDAPHQTTALARSSGTGIQGWELRLSPDDRLLFDQSRFVAVEVGSRPEVWLLANEETGAADDLGALIIQNLIAPPGLPAERQIADLRIVRTGEFGGGRKSLPATPLLIVVRSDQDVPTDAIERLVERGATLLILAGGDRVARGGPMQWCVLRPPRIETLDGPMMMRSEERGADGSAMNFERIAVRRRLRIEPGAAATTTVRFADGAPAIVSVQRGAGAVVLLATSPDPGWSDLGIQAGVLLTWIDDLFIARFGSARSADLSVGESSRRAFTGLPPSGLVRVACVSNPDASRPRWLRISDGTPEQPWPADEPGIYAINTARDPAPLALYSVNYAAEESDLSPLPPGFLNDIFATRSVLLSSEPFGESLPGFADRLFGSDSARTAVALCLVLGLLVEQFLLSRRQKIAIGSQGRQESPHSD